MKDVNPSIGLCWGTFQPMSVLQLIRLAGRHGYTSLMFAPTQWLREDFPAPGEAMQLLDANGITLRSLDGVLVGLPRLPPETRAYALAEDEYFRIASAVDATCFNLPHYLGDPATPIGEFVDALRPLAERAAKVGISLGLEFLPGSGIPDLAAANRISNAVGLPNVGVTLDTWHFARTGGQVSEIAGLPPGRIKAFQINDRAADAGSVEDEAMWGRLVPGEGSLPLTETIAAVLANNPNVGIDAEIFSKALIERPDDETAARVAESLRTLTHAAKRNAPRPT